MSFAFDDDIQVAYIAGPRSKLTPEELGHKASEASQVEAHMVKRGWRVYNPYGSCFHQDAWALPAETWYTHDYFWLGFCNAIVLLPGWEASVGAQRELALARQWDYFVYEWLENRLVPWHQCQA